MGAKERSENLAPERFMTMRDHSHFAGASKRSHRTAQPCVTLQFCEHSQLPRNFLGTRLNRSERRKRFCTRLSGPCPGIGPSLRKIYRPSRRENFPKSRTLARNSTVLPLGTLPPQQTHLLNEPINYLRGHRNAMPDAENKFRSRGGDLFIFTT